MANIYTTTAILVRPLLQWCVHMSWPGQWGITMPSLSHSIPSPLSPQWIYLMLTPFFTQKDYDLDE